MELVQEKYKQSEVGLIPSDWEVKALGEISKIIGGGTPSTTNPSFWNGNINWFTPTEIGKSKYSYESVRKITLQGLENSSARILPIGTILLTTRAGIGDVSILQNEAATNQGFQSFVVNNGTSNEYFYYLIATLKNVFLQNASGSTFLEISPNKIKAILIALPFFEEQTAIATALSDADAWINSLEQLIGKKRFIKQGVMQELLQPKEGWEVKKLGECAFITKLAGFEYSLHFNSYKDEGEIVVIRGTNITNNKLDLDDIKTIPTETSKKLPRSKLSKNDLVFAYVGTIGPIYLVEENDKFHLGPNTSKISVNKGINSKYIYHYFTSESIKKEIIEHTSIGAQPSLSMSKIRSFNILVPDFEEQTRIATILSDMDAEITALEEKLEKAKQVKLGMMQELLTGRIRLV